METFSALLAVCAGNSPVTGEFSAQRPVTRSFDVFFDLRLSKHLSKQSWGGRFETPSRSLWRHCHAVILNTVNPENSMTWRRFPRYWLFVMGIQVSCGVPSQRASDTGLMISLSSIWGRHGSPNGVVKLVGISLTVIPEGNGSCDGITLCIAGFFQIHCSTTINSQSYPTCHLIQSLLHFSVYNELHSWLGFPSQRASNVESVAMSCFWVWST